MLNNNKGSSYENSKKKKNKKMSLKQKGQLKDVCIAKATAFLRNCGSLPLLLGEELLWVFLVLLTICQNSEYF